MNTRYALTTLLAILIAATLGFIGWETDWGRALRGGAPELTPRSANLDTKSLPPFQLAPLEQNYKEMIERPLFTSSRRPAPPANQLAQEMMKKGQFKLAGTSVSAGLSVAFLVETATNKTHRVSMGSDINGIKVTRVEASRIVMTQGEESEELSLRSSVSPKIAPPAPLAQVAAGGQPLNQPGQQGMPGVPGGNFGPPISQGAGPPPGSLGIQNAQVQPAFVPGQAPNQVAGAPPSAQGMPPVPGQVLPTTPNATNPPDPNGVQMRRRRFQNLPQ